MADDEQRWREWKEVTFGTDFIIWHDGLDTGAVTALEGADRAEAVEILRLGLELGDAHAAQALEAMGVSDAAPRIKDKLRRASGVARVTMAQAAHGLEPEPGLATDVIRVLQSGAHWGTRYEAAMALRDFDTEESVEALLEAVRSDGDYLVRYHAASSLLDLAGAESSDVFEHPEIFECIAGDQDVPPTKEDLARYARGAALLEDMLAQRKR